MPLFGRHVMADDQIADRVSAGVVAPRNRHSSQKLRSILTKTTEETGGTPFIQGALVEFGDQAGADVLGRVQHFAGSPDDFTGIVSINLRRPAVPPDDASFQILGDDAVFGGAVENVPKKFARLEEIAFEALPVRDIAADGPAAEDHPRFRHANQEVLVRNGNRLLGVPVPEVRFSLPLALFGDRWDDDVQRKG